MLDNFQVFLIGTVSAGIKNDKGIIAVSKVIAQEILVSAQHHGIRHKL